MADGSNSMAADRTRKRRRITRVVLASFGLSLLAIIAFGFHKYTHGYVPPFAYEEYVANDDSCRVLMPGMPYRIALSPEPISKSPFGSGGMYVTKISYWTVTESDMGWYNLTATDFQLNRTSDLLDQIRRWHVRQMPYSFTVERETPIKQDGHDGVEVRLASGNRRYLARYVVVRTGAQPRVYYLSVGGPHFDQDGEDAEKVIGSFRINH